ncbi:MAG: hypothetical protein H6607_09055 [Flavobacteriales bacterium]|nr:hypothetical protein [Flavobacteriales bacterium]
MWAFESPTAKKTIAIPFSGKFFTTDNLGNVFFVQKDNSIEKLNKDGKIVAKTNFKIYGNLTQLDVSNPFQIYAYYRDQQTLLILDNMLGLQHEINMAEMSTSEIASAIRSFNNNIWCFDAASMKLKRVTFLLNTEAESQPFGLWTTEKWNPQMMLDNETNVFVYDSVQGFSIFDEFGNYYKSIDIKGLSQFQVKKENILWYKNHTLSSYNYKYFKTDTLAIDSFASCVRLEENQLYSWKNDTLKIIFK